MADLALGAVHSLLGLIRDEALLLGRVQGDVQFIRDEMESMNSFLLHLSKTTPPGGEHDEQVRTWMKQVRDLACACSNCIDLYVQQRDPEIQRASGRRGYVWWLPWFLRAVVAQHRAATQLRELKIRARDVSERRQRYGVQVPKGKDGVGVAGTATSLAGAVAVEERGRRVHLVQDAYLRRVLDFTEPDILKDCTEVVLTWLAAANTTEEEGQWPRVIAVVAPDKEDGREVAKEVSRRLASLQPSLQFEYSVRWLRLPEYFPIATSWHLLYSMLGELRHPGLPISDDEAAVWGKMEEGQLASMIERHLQVKGKRSLIVLERLNDVHVWEGFKRALDEFGCAPGSAVIVTTNYIWVAKKVMSVGEDPVIYSLVHFYKKELQMLKRPYDNATGYQEEIALRTIMCDILKKSEASDTCMKLFFHSLYCNPDWSKQELERLRSILELPDDAQETNASKMLMFCYNTLPKDFKSCLLYLAIFPQGQEIRRSSLVGRWVAEGFITKEDWSSSVHQAERCFDELVDRWFVCPVSIGATGKVKSCKVQNVVIHRFISELAKIESFIDRRRLSHHLAWHFSSHSGLWLRRSDTVTGFLQSLPPSSQLQLLKVLDLQGCKDLEKNKNQYLKNICNKMLLLKYLSLRGTGITHLPMKINKLQQLEVLDIRQTKVPHYATKYIVLPKLKRLLAGGISDYTTISSVAKESFTAVEMPLKIEKMIYMEVLSHVQVSRSQKGDAMLQKIGRRLWLLKKLGVVIYNKETHIHNLLGAISDLSECLQSLSVRIKLLPDSDNTTSKIDTAAHIPAPESSVFKNPPKLLESLSINGITSTQLLLPLLVCQLSKITLSNTLLNHNYVDAYLAKLPKLRCLRLRCKSYVESTLTLKKGDFQCLEYLLVESSDITSISFDVGAAPMLEKIMWAFTSMESLTGIGHLTVLKELEFIGVSIPYQVREDIVAHPNHPVLKLDQPRVQGEAVRSASMTP
ncbi:hypothetical protein BAE44_0022699 [Dichanthelium oligosanthes]|uniref:Uncharacterized protein n=1 Tax=Dichanthelium oligosanthes TaxID=888268 RepID=A0A1E5UTT3_9POAL|nr:hypothetical protein BAE44_0022699 [Dichanthelium oligosanthes]